jgi:hypothetical protein
LPPAARLEIAVWWWREEEEEEEEEEERRMVERMSGQRVAVLMFAPRPSVRESPRMERAVVVRGVQAVRAVMKYQCSREVVPGEVRRLGVVVWSPGVSQVVVREPGWEVMAEPDWPVAR